ncbi:thiamine diphosphokinase [Alkalihalobacillus sp. CinArs1]|uniref:thiamine diphosphokinase n=1 Tax=Alkalihalobacillus sp. CinArs1 TaxID=2995314 RepID=UPI0022DDEBFD|nr:thiamine diphosphokinase [Alkalihalobacillus sp. CinArs1]
MTNEAIYLVASGPVSDLPQNLLKDKRGVQWVGVDRGVYTLLKHGITPSQGFGDFDSVTPEEREWIETHNLSFHVYPSEKDHTDLELALDWAIDQRPSEIIMYGVTGGRLDHSWMNVQMLIKGLKSGVSVKLEDRQNRLQLKGPGHYSIENDARYPYASFLSYTPEVKGLTLEGFKFPLTDKKLEWGSSLCISNELVEENGSYSFTEGILMVVRSSDAEHQD